MNPPNDREQQLIKLFLERAQTIVPAIQLAYVIRCDGLGPGLYLGLAGQDGNSLPDDQAHQLRRMAVHLAIDEEYMLDATADKSVEIEGQFLDIDSFKGTTGQVLPFHPRLETAATITAAKSTATDNIIPHKQRFKIAPVAIAAAVACIAIAPAIYMSQKFDQSMASYSKQVKEQIATATPPNDVSKEQMIQQLMARVKELETKNTYQIPDNIDAHSYPVPTASKYDLPPSQRDYDKLASELKTLKALIQSLPRDQQLVGSLSEIQRRLATVETNQRALQSASLQPAHPQTAQNKVPAPRVVQQDANNPSRSPFSDLTITPIDSTSGQNKQFTAAQKNKDIVNESAIFLGPANRSTVIPVDSDPSSAATGLARTPEETKKKNNDGSITTSATVMVVSPADNDERDLKDRTPNSRRKTAKKDGIQAIPYIGLPVIKKKERTQD